jgi:hypothetical protein
MNPLRIIGPKDRIPEFETPIDTTSRSRNWSRGLSPFFLGPVPLYAGAVVPTATNVENAWQYSKVYLGDVTKEGDPAEPYFEWAKEGWSDPRAQRYPKGKGSRPEYTWWAGEKLGYIEARKKVYIPLYAHAVAPTGAFAQLLALYRSGTPLVLWDFDGYDHHALGMTLKDVVNDPKRKMGHAFVLAILLEQLG